MSGVRRALAEKDPDYEEIAVAPPSKRHRAAEQSARDIAVQKIETIIKEQFAVEMKNKEHEIEVIDQRLIEARRMMDKLRACIVANYYASAGLLKPGEGTRSCDATILNHPSIKKFLESPSRSSSPAHQGSDAPSANHSESDSLSQHNDFFLDKDSGSLDADERLANSLDQRQSRSAGRDSLGVSSSQKPGQRNAGLSNDETSRLYVKKTIVVGNVSKYIPPDKREENDQSTHKWMVYVRGSRREPSINHFVKKVWFFLHPSYKPNDLVEVREPPFHLTRRGWGEFPVRVQIHFKDSQNKRIDIIHNLKLDRTYTGLQTLGAETVVDVELHRHSLGEEYLFSQSSESDLSDAPASLPLPLSIPAPVKASSPIKQLRDSSPDASVDKAGGFPVCHHASSLSHWESFQGAKPQISHWRTWSFYKGDNKTGARRAAPATPGVSSRANHADLCAAVCHSKRKPHVGLVTAEASCEHERGDSSVQVMATLQLPATNLANLANLPPGTKLYLTTNSKNPSGKGKLLLIPQGAILRATNNASLQSGGSTNSGGGGTQSTSSNLSQHLTYTSYILKQTPQATASGQTSLMKISDGSLKSVSASSQLSKPGTTVLRVSGGVITTAAAPAVALPTNGVAQQIDHAGSSSSSSGAPTAKTSGQQHQVCINQTQSASSVASKTATSTVVSVASLVTTPTPVTGKAAVSVIQSLSTSKVSAVTAVTSASTAVSSPSVASITKVKMEPDSTGQNCTSVGTQEGQAAVKTEENSELGNYVINIEYLENTQQLLTAIVKKVPLIAEKSEDVSSYCAGSVEQYYSWNIGKRRAAEWQRAMTVRKILQEIIEKHPRFHSITPLKTKHVVQWCRCHGYTPPDPETLRNDEDSIEDVLTQIDSEPEYPSSYSSGEDLCRKLEELQQFLKQEPEHEEEVDVLNFSEPLKINIKKEQEEKQEEMKFYLASLPASEFVRETAEKIGISFQPAEVQRNVYASVIEDMILKATEQLMSDILRQALAVAYQTTPHNRTPREITVMNIHKAICNIPFLDFLTNKHMKILNEEQ